MKRGLSAAQAGASLGLARDFEFYRRAPFTSERVEPLFMLYGKIRVPLHVEPKTARKQ